MTGRTRNRSRRSARACGAASAATSARACGRIGRSCGRRPNRRGDDAARPHQAQIAGEIYTALERLGTGPELVAIVGSWGDTLADRPARGRHPQR
jgi:hypothetical protein